MWVVPTDNKESSEQNGNVETPFIFVILYILRDFSSTDGTVHLIERRRN